MSSYVSMLVRFVWSTKSRKPTIEPAWSDRLYGYLGGILRNNGARLIAAGGTADHVHLLVTLPSTLTVAKSVNLMKSNSTNWVRDNVQHTEGFRWQEKYGAFSVSKSGEQRVIEYIANQEEHHRRTTFQEEFRVLLERHRIEVDERYLSD